MPQFEYVGYTTQSKKVKGVIEARDRRGAFVSLKEKGVQIVSLTSHKQSILTKDIEFLEPRVKTQDFVLFCRQFATLLEASVGIAEALQILIQQTNSKILKKALEKVLEDVRGGTALSRACQDHPKVFSTLFINMVKAGESSGTLDEVLEKLATFFEKEYTTISKIKSAMAYPVLVTVFAFLVTFILMWKVIPQFISTFQSLGLELPWITRFVIKVSDFFIHDWYLILLTPFLIYIVIRGLGKTEKGQYYLDYIKLRIPVFGVLFLKSALARFCRTFCTLYSAAVPIIQILSILSNVVGSKVISRSLEQAKENLRSGQPLVTPFKTNKIFPPMLVHMIGVGEKTGSLDKLLEKIADFYEDEVDRMTDQMRSLIEPIMIVIVAIIVGTIVMAILLPTFSMYGGIK